MAPGQALERKPSKAWARKIPALITPKNAVTVSIIASLPVAARGGENARAGRTVKRIPCPNRKSAPTDDLMQQVVQPASSKRRQPGLPQRLAATIDSLRRRSPHFRRVPPAVCSYVNAEMICIGDVGSPSA